MYEGFKFIYFMNLSLNSNINLDTRLFENSSETFQGNKLKGIEVNFVRLDASIH